MFGAFVYTPRCYTLIAHSGFKTSRHYFAGLLQAQLPAFGLTPDYREDPHTRRDFPCGMSGGWFWNHE